MEREIIIKKVSSGTFKDDRTGEEKEFASVVIDGEKFQSKGNVVGFVSPKLRVLNSQGKPDLMLADRFKQALIKTQRPVKLKVVCDLLEKAEGVELFITGVPSGVPA